MRSPLRSKIKEIGVYSERGMRGGPVLKLFNLFDPEGVSGWGGVTKERGAGEHPSRKEESMTSHPERRECFPINDQIQPPLS